MNRIGNSNPRWVFVAMVGLYVLVFLSSWATTIAHLPFGHDDVGLRLTSFVSPHVLLQDQRPLVWLVDVMSDSLFVEYQVVPELFLRLSYYLSLICLFASVFFFSSRLLVESGYLRLAFEHLWITNISLVLVSQFSSHATIYFFATAATIFGSWFAVERRWVWASTLLYLGVCGYQTNLYLFIANLMLISLMQLSHGKQELSYRQWFQSAWCIALVLVLYQVTVVLLSKSTYGQLPGIASWREPNYPTNFSALVRNLSLFFSQLWKVPVYDWGMLAALFMLLFSAIRVRSDIAQSARLIFACVIAVLILKTMMQATTLLLGVEQPLRALHMYFYGILFLMLPIAGRNNSLATDARVVLLGLVLVSATFINHQDSRAYVDKENCQVEKLAEIVSTVQSKQDATRLTIVSEATVAPLLMNWLPLNAFYYLGPLRFPIEIQFLTVDSTAGSTADSTTTLNQAQANDTIALWGQAGHYFVSWQDSLNRCQ